jgi:signal transduction histidine kinase/ActR/RegA family two-component response regulator
MHVGTFSENKTPYRWKSYVLILMALWTVIIATSLVWNLFEMKNRVLETARTQADMAYTKNIIYRRWNTEHGGVYVEVREDLQPNPFLEDIPERDIVTPSGKVLTLINPAFMMRQVYEITKAAHGINERLVSLVPLNPDNMADPWEAEALRGFESSAAGVSMVTEIEGIESMRYIRPLATEKSCLRCHEKYREGDIPGAISIMLPMGPIWAAAKRSASTLVAAHILLWLLGSGGILLMAIRLRRTEMDRMRVLGDLKASRAGLEVKVTERTAELAETNEALCQDIIKRESAEEALKAETGHLYSILDIIPGLVYLQARNHSIRFANRRFIEEYGEPGKRPCYEVMWKRSEPCEECPTFRVFETKKPEVSVSEHPSRGRTYQVYDEPFVDSDGTLLVLEISIDITERKKLEAQALKTQKLDSLGILAGGIAHDFNNLLTGIIGNLSLAELAAGKGKNEGIYKRLVEVEKAAIQARDLTQQLLTFSKGGQPVKETIAIGAFIKESVCFAMRGSSLRCEFSIADDLWYIDADKGQLNQVISNLVINAGQAMPEGGVITARAENRTVTGRDKLPLKDGRYVMVSIEDQGVGIPQELLTKIFDPYFTTKEKGSGLGLASAFSVVKKHGGYIYAASEPGAGTTFRFYLPASGEDAAVKKEADKKIPASAGGRVLVMDDEEIVRDVVGDMLTSLGYEAVTVEEGNEAVRLYKEALDKGEPFDVVIMDLTVPGGIGGKETVKRLLEIDPGARVVVSSGYSNDSIMANYKDYGFSDVITKPYTVEELSEKLYHVIKEGH